MPTTNFVNKHDFLNNLRERADITVPLLQDMYNIKTFIRKWGVLVYVYDDPIPDNNGAYILKYNKNSDIISDNLNWEEFPPKSDFLIVPNYYVTDLTEFLAAYTDIRANYNGGNIYINGNVILVANLVLDMTGINVFGTGAYGRIWNCNGYLSTSPVYKIDITSGNPTFTNIIFSGSDQNRQREIGNWPSRNIFDLSNPNASRITFDKCIFTDIVTGVDNPNGVINITANFNSYTEIYVRFYNCMITSRTGSEQPTSAYELAGFHIRYSGLSPEARIYIQVLDQFADQGTGSTYPKPLNNSSIKFKLSRGVFNPSRIVFHSDETAFLSDFGTITGLLRTNIINEALPKGIVPVDENDRLLINEISSQNIKSISVQEFIDSVIAPNVPVLDTSKWEDEAAGLIQPKGGEILYNGVITVGGEGDEFYPYYGFISENAPETEVPMGDLQPPTYLSDEVLGFAWIEVEEEVWFFAIIINPEELFIYDGLTLVIGGLTIEPTIYMEGYPYMWIYEGILPDVFTTPNSEIPLQIIEGNLRPKVHVRHIEGLEYPDSTNLLYSSVYKGYTIID